MHIIEGSLEVKLPTIWTDGKSRAGKSQGGEEKEVRRSEKRKKEKKEDASARKGRKVAIHYVFPMICGSGGSKSRLAKAAGAETSGQMRDEQLHAIVARSTFPSQNVQNTPGSDHFFEVAMSKKLHAIVARSTFSSQKCQKLPASDHFWKLRCRKKCTPLWREAHFQVKMYKTRQLRTPFGSWDVEKVRAVVARSTFPSQKCQKLRGSDHFWRFRCGCAWQAQGVVNLAKSEQNVRALYQFQLQPTKHCTTPHYLTLHYSTLHYTAPHYTTLHCTTLHYTTLTTLHHTTLHYTTLQYTTLQYATLPYATLRFTTLQYTTLQYNTLH